MPDPDAALLLMRAQAQLLSLAVHEFRTPASVVGGYLRMLQRDTTAPLTKRQQRMVEDAEKACAQMVALVGELNEISKLDDPAIRLRRESVDLAAMLRDIVGETTEGADRGVRIKLRGKTTGAVLTGDAVRLHAAIGAILRAVVRQQNDGEAALAECRVTRENKRASALIVIAGEEEVAQTLEATPAPFDDKRGGLGLALPIARRVIELHGGRVWSPPAEKGELGTRRAAIVSLPLD